MVRIDGNMRVAVSPSKVSGSVTAPPSKSYTHRAIAVASLSVHSTITDALLSGDTSATVDACRAFGASVSTDGRSLNMEGNRGNVKTPDDVVNAMNSGTTLRFMTAVASLADGVTVLTGDDSLRRRPNGPLLNALGGLGVKAISTKGNGTAPLVVWGKMKGGETSIDGGVSSQFISAMLIAAPLASRSSYIKIKREMKSRSYVDITIDVLEAAGAHVSIENDGFQIPGGQEFNLRSFRIPGDFSSASYFLAAAAVTNSRVTVRNLFPSKQGDERILSILEEMGAGVRQNKNSGTVEVSGAPLEGVTLDLSDNPDLVPTVAVLGAVSKGRTEIKNVAHVRLKESDRLATVTSELRKMGAKIREKKDGLIIEESNLRGANVESYGDHRIAMAMTVAALAAKGKTVIKDAECASISYPTFFGDMGRIGVKIEEVK